jgi:hypothetical protein
MDNSSTGIDSPDSDAFYSKESGREIDHRIALVTFGASLVSRCTRCSIGLIFSREYL